MKIDVKDKISVLLTLISFLAIVISLLTLFEMKSQRELEITPFVQLNPGQSFAIYNVESDVCDTSVFKQNYFVNESESSFAFVSLINIGNGAAINTNIEWDVDTSWVIDFLERKNIPDSLLNFEFTKDEFYSNYSTCNTEARYSFTTKDVSDIGHLVSAKSNNSKYDIEIPKEILLMNMACFTSDWIINNVNDNNNYYEISSIHNLNISYSSIHNKRFKSTFQVEVIVTPKSGGSESKNEHFEYWTTFNEFRIFVNIK